MLSLGSTAWASKRHLHTSPATWGLSWPDVEASHAEWAVSLRGKLVGVEYTTFYRPNARACLHIQRHACYYYWQSVQMACARGCHKHVPLDKGTQHAGLSAAQLTAGRRRRRIKALQGAARSWTRLRPACPLPQQRCRRDAPRHCCWGQQLSTRLLRQVGSNTRRPADPSRTASAGAQGALEAVNLDQSLLCELVVHLRVTAPMGSAAERPHIYPAQRPQATAPDRREYDGGAGYGAAQL